MKRGTKEAGPKSAGGPVSDVMTLPQVADYLHCHYSTIYRLVRQRAIPAFRIGGGWRFRRSDLNTWMENQAIVVVPKGESGNEPKKGNVEPRRKTNAKP